MTESVQSPITAVVVHARQVPAAERERFAKALRTAPIAGSLVVETCHRVEAYAARVDVADLARLTEALPEGGRVLSGDEAVRHAITVATGHDSVVVGEDQIGHQLRTSLDQARSSGPLDPSVDRLFTIALHAGRRARSWQPGRRRSLADVALETIERMTGSVRERRILVVGAGRMGTLAARAAASAGARVTVANRSRERASALAGAIGAATADLDPGPGSDRFVAVILALGGRWAIGPATMAELGAGRAIVVDLSVPPATPDGLSERLGERLVNADDLALADAPGGSSSDPRIDRLIDTAVAEYLEWQARGTARAAADALVQRADREREAELARLWRELPTLEPEAREAIEGMTRHLAARLLRQPLERLGRDSDGADGRIVRDLFAL